MLSGPWSRGRCSAAAGRIDEAGLRRAISNFDSACACVNKHSAGMEPHAFAWRRALVPPHLREWCSMISADQVCDCQHASTRRPCVGWRTPCESLGSPPPTHSQRLCRGAGGIAFRRCGGEIMFRAVDSTASLLGPFRADLLDTHRSIGSSGDFRGVGFRKKRDSLQRDGPHTPFRASDVALRRVCLVASLLVRLGDVCRRSACLPAHVCGVLAQLGVEAAMSARRSMLRCECRGIGR